MDCTIIVVLDVLFIIVNDVWSNSVDELFAIREELAGEVSHKGLLVQESPCIP